MDSEHARPGVLALVTRGQFAWFFWAAGISSAGMWMQALAVPFAVYEVTGSRSWLGIAALVGQLPAVAGNVVAGSLADRLPRRQILLVTQSLLMALTLLLWALWVAGYGTLTPLLVIVFVTGFLGGIKTPVWNSLVPLLVERERLGDAIRLNSLQFSAARVLGPVVAGVVLGRYGAGAAFLVIGLSYTTVVGVLTIIRPRPVPAMSTAPALEQIRDGFAYTYRHASLMLSVATITVVSFFGASITLLLPAIANEHLGLQPSSIGWLSAAYGVGMLLSVSVAVSLADRVGRSSVAATAMLAWIVGLALVGLVPTYLAGLAGFFAMGVGHVLIAQSAQISIQMQVPEQYRGRVLSAYFQGLFLGSPLGAFFLAALADVAGIRAAVLFAAVGLLAYLVVVQVRWGGFRLLDADAPVPSRRAARATAGARHDTAPAPTAAD